MKHADFRIGCEFLMGGCRWRCTDVGTRTIVAIKLEHDDDPSWYNGPPYAVAEAALDEYDIEGCERVPKSKRERRSKMPLKKSIQSISRRARR